MVEEGVTVRDPLIGLTDPIPLIYAEVAFEDDQEIEELLPEVMLEGVAVREQVGTGGGGGGVAVTVTVAEQVAEPPAPVTVMV